MKKSLWDSYHEWLVRQVADRGRPNYNELLLYLDTEKFEPPCMMDLNRASKGLDLRYEFAGLRNIPDAEMEYWFIDIPCSMLEMMVALCLDIEDRIMYNEEQGNRTSLWFWTMVRSLGLEDMTDDRFDPDYCDDVMDVFDHRDYAPNGAGGLFTCERTDKDMRTMEIWYQMCEYTNMLIDYGY